jgi:phage/plasmid-like protein (TIGR03299 family)
MTRNLVSSYMLLGKEAQGTTAQEVLQNAGLDFNVSKHPSGYMNHEGRFVGNPGHFVTVRDDTGLPLGQVGKSYTVYQNEDAIRICDPLVGEGLIEYDRIANIDIGRKFMASMRMPEGFSIAGWDDVEQYIYIINSHDGSSGIRVIPANFRLACSNQFAYLDSLLRKAGINPRALSIRHSSKINERVSELREALKIVDHLNETFAHTAEDMMKVELELADRIGYYIDAVGLKTDEELIDKVENPFGLTTRGRNTLDRLLELETSETNTSGGIGGTVWGSFNTVTEFLDHAWVYDRKGEKVNEKRVESSLLGTGMRMKDRAWQGAIELLA